MPIRTSAIIPPSSALPHVVSFSICLAACQVPPDPIYYPGTPHPHPRVRPSVVPSNPDPRVNPSARRQGTLRASATIPPSACQVPRSARQLLSRRQLLFALPRVRYRLARSTTSSARQVPPIPIRASATTIPVSYYPPFHASGSLSVRYPLIRIRPSARGVFALPRVRHPLTRSARQLLYPFPRRQVPIRLSHLRQPLSSAAIRPAACQVPPDYSTIPSSARQVPPIPPLYPPSARQVPPIPIRA